jgi:hypothetical protein
MMGFNAQWNGSSADAFRLNDQLGTSTDDTYSLAIKLIGTFSQT